MNAAAWKRLVSPLLDDSWRVQNTLVYRRPVAWTLHAVLGEGSQARAGFYVWLVRMPLFVPTTVINLNWSERYGGGTRTYDPMDEGTHDALAGAMKNVEREAEKAQLVPSPPGGADNVKMQEARGYGLFLQGDPGAALEVLGRVVRYNAEYAWEHEFVDRAAEMRGLISAGRHRDVSDRLAAWRSDSLRTLGIGAG